MQIIKKKGYFIFSFPAVGDFVLDKLNLLGDDIIYCVMDQGKMQNKSIERIQEEAIEKDKMDDLVRTERIGVKLFEQDI